MTARVDVRSAPRTSSSPGSATFSSSSVAPHRKYRALTRATPAPTTPTTATNRASSYLRRLTEPPNAVRMLWAGWPPPHDARAPVPHPPHLQGEHYVAPVVLRDIAIGHPLLASARHGRERLCHEIPGAGLGLVASAAARPGAGDPPLVFAISESPSVGPPRRALHVRRTIIAECPVEAYAGLERLARPTTSWGR